MTTNICVNENIIKYILDFTNPKDVGVKKYIFFKKVDNTLKVVACEGRAMAIKTIPFEAEWSLPEEGIALDFNAFAKNFGKKNNPVYIKSVPGEDSKFSIEMSNGLTFTVEKYGASFYNFESQVIKTEKYAETYQPIEWEYIKKIKNIIGNFVYCTPKQLQPNTPVQWEADGWTFVVCTKFVAQ